MSGPIRLSSRIFSQDWVFCLPQASVLHHERYTAPQDLNAEIGDYDAQLRDFQASEGLPEVDWSDLVLQYVMYLEIMHHWRTVLPGRVVDLR